MGKNDVERLGGMFARHNGCKLRDERARHRDVGLRAVDRIGPMHPHGAFAEGGLAALPILLAHMHAKRRGHLFRVGDDVNLMAACREAVRSPIGPHADAALYRRKCADLANSHRHTSTSPARAKSSSSWAVSAVASNAVASVH